MQNSLYLPYSLFADSIWHLEMLPLNCQGIFSAGLKLSGEFFSRGDSPRGKLSMVDFFCAGEIIHQGIFHGSDFPIEGDSWNNCLQKEDIRSD